MHEHNRKILAHAAAIVAGASLIAGSAADVAITDGQEQEQEMGVDARAAGSLVSIAVGRDGDVWAIDEHDNVFLWINESFVQIPGKLRQISVGLAGQAWGIDRHDNVFRWNGSTWAANDGVLSQVSAGADGTVWGVSSNGLVWRWRTDLGGWWQNMPGCGMAAVSVANADDICGADLASRVYRWTSSGWDQIAASRALPPRTDFETVPYAAKSSPPLAVARSAQSCSPPRSASLGARTG